MTALSYAVRASTAIGWLNLVCEYAKGQAQLRVRRVKPRGDPEQVQVEIHVLERKGARVTARHGSMVLPPQAIDLLVTALTKLRPPPAPPRSHREPTDYEAREAFDREFYGLSDQLEIPWEG